MDFYRCNIFLSICNVLYVLTDTNILKLSLFGSYNSNYMFSGCKRKKNCVDKIFTTVLMFNEIKLYKIRAQSMFEVIACMRYEVD